MWKEKLKMFLQDHINVYIYKPQGSEKSLK